MIQSKQIVQEELEHLTEMKNRNVQGTGSLNELMFNGLE